MHNSFKKIVFSATVLLLICTKAQAVLDIKLTHGVDKAVPIAVVPFAWEGRNAPPSIDVSTIIGNDLHNSGEFYNLDKRELAQFPSRLKEVDYQYWRDQEVHNIVIGRIEPAGIGQFKVEFSLLDLFSAQQNIQNDPVLLSQEFIVREQDLRRLAHHISDLIYLKLTGEQGVFSTRLAYVVVQRHTDGNNQYTLEVSDFDGANARPILRSSEPIMSPSWSPDGKKLAYVSFEGKRARIFISDTVTGNRELISQFPGINGAPAWSPDGKSLAVALSQRANSPNIYLLNLANKNIVRLTNDSAIDTEPSWSPDGKSIIFTSDRGGSAQIYQIDLNSHNIKRITYKGDYNSSAKYSPNGRSLILLHRNQQHAFNIAVMNLENNTVWELTRTGRDESPSLSPNGKMIVYASQENNFGVLGIISIDGRVQLTLPARNGSVQEPVWSPYLQQT